MQLWLFPYDYHMRVPLPLQSHPGKIVERHWYERNKHIFPASRWEVYDPTVNREKYTTHGGEIR